MGARRLVLAGTPGPSNTAARTVTAQAHTYEPPDQRASRAAASASQPRRSRPDNLRSSTQVSIAFRLAKGSASAMACAALAVQSLDSECASQTQEAKRCGAHRSRALPGAQARRDISKPGTETLPPPPAAAASTSPTATRSPSRRRHVSGLCACSLEQLAIPRGRLARAALVSD